MAKFNKWDAFRHRAWDALILYWLISFMIEHPKPKWYISLAALGMLVFYAWPWPEEANNG